MIRKATSGDLDRISEIEADAYPLWAAACGFAGGSSAMPREIAEQCMNDGLLFVAADDGNRPIGFVAAAEWGGGLYIGEIDVEAASQRRGIGRKLMETILDEGRRRYLPFATLTTDRFAPFNAPFYSTLGFAEIADNDLSDFLRQKLADEIDAGLDPTRRMAMRLELLQGPGATEPVRDSVETLVAGP